MLIDWARAVHLCDVGLPGWCAALTVATDGSEHLVLLATAAIGTGERYDAMATEIAHEQLGPLPAAIAARAGLICGAPARTKAGQPCRNRVSAQGRRCQWHTDKAGGQ